MTLVLEVALATVVRLGFFCLESCGGGSLVVFLMLLFFLLLFALNRLCVLVWVDLPILARSGLDAWLVAVRIDLGLTLCRNLLVWSRPVVPG